MRIRHLAILAAVVWACDGGGGGTDPGAPADPGPADEGPADEGPAADLPPQDAPPADEGPGDAAVPDEGPGPDLAADVAKDDGPPPVGAECAAVVVGQKNTLTVDGTKRSFYLNAPPEASGPGGKWPVVFLWHGFSGASVGQPEAAGYFRTMLSGKVADPAFPFLLVTPVPDGQAFLDWNILDIATGDDCPDVRLFDEVLACLDGRFGVDPDRVHSAGFSAGALMTDLLGVTRGDRLGGLISWSGAYLANEAHDTGNFDVYWPDLGPSSGWTQLVTRGGPTDLWQAGALFTADFDQWTRNDIPWLNALGHDVVECPHAKGHTPYVIGDVSYAVEFLRDHPRGVTASPWAAALPASLPAGCVFHPKTP